MIISLVVVTPLEANPAESVMSVKDELAWVEPEPTRFNVSVVPLIKMLVAPRLSSFDWLATVELTLNVRFALVIVDVPTAERFRTPEVSVPPAPTRT